MTVAERLDKVLHALHTAAERSARSPGEIALIAVSKKQPTSLMHEYQQAAAHRGLPVIFGENYVQELKAKRGEFKEPTALHMIGPLQSNKIRDAVRYADVIQSVHSLSVLQGIAEEALKQGKKQKIFLQVNIGDDPRKSGFHADDVPQVLGDAAKYSTSLSLIGLMTITPLYDDPELARPDFARMRKLREMLVSGGLASAFENSSPLLSMGMSADFAVAIEEGADLVRVGTALFGERPAY
jgi:pyridoxal phosphate enzyme (YggS family)